MRHLSARRKLLVAAGLFAFACAGTARQSGKGNAGTSGEAGHDAIGTSGSDSNPNISGESGGGVGSGGYPGAADGGAGEVPDKRGDGGGGMGPTQDSRYPDICETGPGSPVRGGARLKAECVKAADGSQVLLRGKLWDTELDTECVYRTAADGSWRCLPVLFGEATRIQYNDAQCTQQVVQLKGPPASCKGGKAFAYTADPPPACGYRTYEEFHVHILRVGQPRKETTPIFDKVGDECVVAGLPSDAAYHVTAELPPSAFVQGTRELLP